jgi:hypothetical protein
MDEEKDKRTTVDLVDNPDEALENEQRMDEREVEDRDLRSTTREEHRSDRPAMDTREEKLVPLFEAGASDKFRTRWLAIQSKFVDDPSDAVKQADDLVTDVIESVTRSFADRRGSLEKQWNGGAKASTEDLRIALKQYRSFFDRLLTLES